MVLSDKVCPKCGASASPAANFCSNCGAGLPTGPSPAPTGPAGAVTWPAVPAGGPSGITYGTPGLDPETAKARDRTATALLLLVIGFALGWIPYISIAGGLIAIIGVILLVLGRRGYGERHQRNASIGGALYFLSLVAAFVVGVAFVGALVGQASSAGTDLTAFGTELTNDLLTLFVASAVFGVIAAIAQVIMVYDLADGTTRILLWAGFVTGVALSVAIGFILLPEIASAVQQATSGSTIDLGPINQLQTTATLLGLTKIVPSLLFAWAYYRCRDEALRPTGIPTSLPKGLQS